MLLKKQKGEKCKNSNKGKYFQNYFLIHDHQSNKSYSCIRNECHIADKQAAFNLKYASGIILVIKGERKL